MSPLPVITEALRSSLLERVELAWQAANSGTSTMRMEDVRMVFRNGGWTGRADWMSARGPRLSLEIGNPPRRKSSRALLHPVAHVHDRLVEGVERQEPHPRILEVDD